jgi:hypothetical protein
MTKSSKRKTTKASGRVILSPVMSYDNPGQLTVPNRLNLGNDAKLYLTRDGDATNPKAKPQSISLKESVAWYRLGHDCNLSPTKRERFNEWLKLIEQALT